MNQEKKPKLESDGGRIRRLVTAIQRMARESPLDRVSRLQRLLARNLQVAILVSTSDVYQRVRLHAQALAFKTLLAIVPLLAVVFAIFKGFGGLNTVRSQLEDIIVSNLAGSEEIRAAVHEHLQSFLANVEGGALGPVSVVILVVSVLSLLSHIEDSINALFGSTTTRPLVMRFTTYWAILTLGPLVLGASLTLTGALQIETVRVALDALPGASQLLIGMTPLLISWLGFTALYIIVPNAKVRFSSAFSAALIAGTGWNALKYLYAYYASHAVTVQNIYGSLAAIPLFMLWIWLSWLLVLYGAQLTFAYENVASFWRERKSAAPSPRAKEIASCRVFLEIARDFVFGNQATDQEQLAAQLELPAGLVNELVDTLVENGFIHCLDDHRLVPARDLSAVNFDDILTALRESERDADAIGSDAASLRILELFDQEKKLTEKLLDVDFADFARRFPPAPSSPAETSTKTDAGTLVVSELERRDVH